MIAAAHPIRRGRSLLAGALVMLTLLGAVACEPSTSPSASATAGPATPEAYDPYAGTQPGVTPGGTTSEGQLQTSDGRLRTFRLYVPSTLPAGQRVPLLVALHGGGGTSAQFETNSGFNDLAESNRFIVVYPDGIPARTDGSGLQTWNGGYCCGAAVTRGVDDVGFIRQLVDSLVATQPVDTGRVYAAGHSNGAIMAYRLACELSDRIKKIGVQAGSLGVDTCTPPLPVSVFHLHGTADTNHPIDGGLGSGISGVAFRPAEDAVRALAAVDGCDAAPIPGADPLNTDLTVATWAGCSSGAWVRYVIVDGATHAWMGHPAASAEASDFVGEPYPDLDASRAIWSFLVATPPTSGSTTTTVSTISTTTTAVTIPESAACPELANPFVDVPPAVFYDEPTACLHERAVTTGIATNGELTYLPDSAVTRAQMAAFLWRLADRPPATAPCGFTDQGAIPGYAGEAVCWLKADNITTADPYNPGGSVTRAQMAAFLWRLADRPPATTPCGFTDEAAIPAFAREGACWLRAEAITTNATYQGASMVNRAQMAAFLYRFGVSRGLWSAPAV